MGQVDYEEDKYNDPNFVFEYDEGMPCCLKWKNPKRNSTIAGKACGTVTFNDQWAVQFRGMPRMAHRVIWEMFHGEMKPDDTIRAKDGNYLNCKIDNLVLETFEGKNTQVESIKAGDWKEVFEYSEGNLFWKDDFWSGRSLQVLNAEAGNEIHTTADKDGYLRVKLGNYAGYMIMLHRVIYEWHFGKIPKGMQIDHINGVNTDNRIENLRCVTKAVNSRNQRMNSRNKTGVNGVRFRNKSNGQFYVAFWRENNKQGEQSFSVNKYGKDEAFRLACEKRKEEINRLNKIYKEECYTEDHGYRIVG